MLYPVAIWKDEESCWSVTVPDIPGCNAAGDTLEEALADVQGAAEALLEDADSAPGPSAVEAHMEDEDYAGARWAYVDLDLSFLDRKVVPVNISMPLYVRGIIDRAAKARGKTRSAFIVESALRAARKPDGAGA